MTDADVPSAAGCPCTQGCQPCTQGCQPSLLPQGAGPGRAEPVQAAKGCSPFPSPPRAADLPTAAGGWEVSAFNLRLKAGLTPKPRLPGLRKPSCHFCVRQKYPWPLHIPWAQPEEGRSLLRVEIASPVPRAWLSQGWGVLAAVSLLPLPLGISSPARCAGSLRPFRSVSYASDFLF